MLAILAGALIGATVGGVPGLLVGGALGYAAGLALRQTVLGSLRIAQSALIDATFSVMGALCKADGVVTRDEIRVVEGMFGRLGLSSEQREAAKEAFRRGKAPDFDLDAAVDGFASITRRREPLVQLFLQLQCMAVAADGAVHEAEHQLLVRVARRLGLHERDVAQLEALLRTAGGGFDGGGAGAAPRQQRLEDAYDALGLPRDASPGEVKRRYRKLISENHPDKLAARGLPESMRAVAEERTREINTAYELIEAAQRSA